MVTGVFKMEKGCYEPRSKVASTSSEQFLANNQQTGTSVLQTQGTRSCSNLNGPGSEFFPRASSKGRSPADPLITAL